MAANEHELCPTGPDALYVNKKSIKKTVSFETVFFIDPVKTVLIVQDTIRVHSRPFAFPFAPCQENQNCLFDN